MKQISGSSFLCRLSYVAALFLFASTAHTQSFTVAANPQAITVNPGQANVPVNISVASSDYAGPIIVTLAGLPSGITMTPTVLTLSAGNTGTIMLNVAPNADQEGFPPGGLGQVSALTNASVVGAVGSVTATSPLALTVSLTNPSFSPAAGKINLPILNITASGPIVKSTTTPMTITITSANGQTAYLPSSANPDNTAVIHVHGNSTAAMPKLSYEIKLNTSLDLLTTMGLVCPYVTSSGKAACDKSKTYILLANYDDKTFLRDWAASALANAIPYGPPYLSTAKKSPTPSGTKTLMPWAPHSLFVEVFINGQYEGNYQLIEKINVDSHRVNITELAETDTTDDVTGGYLLEMDPDKGEAYNFVSTKNLMIGVVDPDFSPDPEVPEQTSYITNYIDSFENALFSPNFTDPVLGWRPYLDEAAAINYYMVMDVMENGDGGEFFDSDYFYKDKDNPLIYMGPVWDFDISSGQSSGSQPPSPTAQFMQTHAVWYTQLFKDPAFKADVVTQFNALKNNGIFTNWINSIATQAARLEQSQANDFGRWPMLDIKVWGNTEAAGSYDGEVAFLIDDLNLRLAYLDSYYNNKATSATSLTAPTGTVYLNAPVALSAHVTAAKAPTGVVTFLTGNLPLGTASLDGTGTATFSTTNLQLGSNVVRAEYNGDSTNALSVSAFAIMNVMAPPVTTVTNLSASASVVAPGTPETLNVTVIANSGTTVPTGTVTFLSNNVALATVSVTAGGTAGYTISSLSAGTDSFQAVYSGDAAHLTSTSGLTSVNVDASSVPVTFGTNPAGLAYSVDGLSYTSQQTLYFDPGTTHTVTTVASQTGNGATYSFANWSDSGAQSHSISASANATYIANFNSSYLLTVSASPSAYGTAGAVPAGGGYYTSGAVVNLAAAAAPGYVFTGWLGPVADPTSATTTVTMNAPATVSATFGPNGVGINYAGGFTAGNLTLNGAAILNGTALQVTAAKAFASGSGFYDYAMNVAAFTSDFTFQLPAPTTDGIMFVIQNEGLKAVGSDGEDLGFGGNDALPHSVGIKFDLVNDAGEGVDSTGLFTNGAHPTVPSTDLTSSGVNLHSGDIFSAHLAYDGVTLTVTVTDTITQASATQSYTVNIPSIIGSNSAYVGFTGSTGVGPGNAYLAQNILTWTYTAQSAVTQPAAPTFVLPAGTYSTPQQIALNEATTNAAVYYTLDGTSPSVNSTPYNGTFTINASAVVNAVAVLNGVPSPVASASYSIILNPNLTFNAIPPVTYGDAPFTVSATSASPAAITYSIVSGKVLISGTTVTITGIGAVTLKATQLAVTGFTAGSITTTFTIAGQNPGLTFTAVPDQMMGAAPFSVSATSPSFGAITYKVLSGPATISGHTVTLTGPGTVQLQATQAAGGNYASATATTSFNVTAQLNPSLAFATVPNQTYGAAPFAVSATSASPAAIVYSVASGKATISGTTVTLTGVGNVTLQAKQAATANYAAATATISFTVAAENPNLTFVAIPDKIVGAAAFGVSAKSSSFGAITYSVVSGPATVSGHTVTLTVGTGLVTLEADQAASGNYTAGTTQTTFNVGSAPIIPTLTFVTVPTQNPGAAAFPVSATSNSPGAITYTVSSGPATIAGNSVTVTGLGKVTLKASQAASGAYGVATATTSFSVVAEAPGLAFVPIPSTAFGGPAFNISATSNSAGAITYSVTSGPASLSAGTLLTLTGLGKVTLQAAQVANSPYAAATVTTSFTVTAEAPVITLAPIPGMTYGDSPFTVSATSTSPAPITYSVSGKASVSGTTVTLTGIGPVTVTAKQAASGNFAAGSTTTSFSIAPKDPGLAFTTIPDQTFGTAPFKVAASSPSFGAVTYIVTGGPATISGHVVTLTGPGPAVVTLQATQAASGNYTSGNATISFNVLP